MKPITEMYLEMFGNKYELLTYNIRLSQNYNHKTGLPDDRPIADSIYVEIKSELDNKFVNWMIEHDKMLDGKITFMVGTKLVKKIHFQEGILVGYNQNPMSKSGSGKEITEDLTISVQVIDFDGAEYQRGDV